MTKPLSLPDKKLTVRLPEADHRRIKSVAARLGLSLQEVVHEALEAWMSHHDPQGTKPRDPRPW